jgi:hypothetical protein
MDVFHHDLETIKAACFRQLYLTDMKFTARFSFTIPSLAEKESKDVGDEVSFAIIQAVPVLLVIRKVDLFGGPEAGFRLFLYISQIAGYLIGKRTKRSLFSFSNTSSFLHKPV